MKTYLVTNSKNWLDLVDADRIEKDVHGNTLMFIEQELVASFPSDFLVTIKKPEEKNANVTVTNLPTGEKAH